MTTDRWEEPEWSLGWKVADFCEAYLKVPGGDDYGKPLTFTGWQMRALADWYAVDRTGRFIYRRGQIRMSKGTGKSPWAAGVAIAELVGPTVFDGWDASGEPVGRPHAAPYGQIAGISEDQAGNTYGAMYAMLQDSPLLDEHGIDLGVTRTVLRGRPNCRVEAVTASAGSREGQPVTFCVADETHLWTRTNGGRRLYAVLARNLSKMNGRLLATTNAYVPGAESVAEQVESASSKAPGILVYGPQYEANVKDLTDRDALMAGLRIAYRDAPWVDLERIAADCADPDMAPEDVARFHLNVSVAADSVLCAEPPTAPAGDLFGPGAWVALGFDGSRTSDATALVAVHMESGVAMLLGYWERPSGHTRKERWEVPRHEVAAAVDVAFARWNVARMKADPSHWVDELAQWQNRWGRDVVDRFPVWLPSVTDSAVDAVQTGFRSGVLSLSDGTETHDEILRAHVARCRVTQRPSGRRVLKELAKPDDGGRIDAAAALTYAVAARTEAIAKGWEVPMAQSVGIW